MAWTDVPQALMILGLTLAGFLLIADPDRGYWKVGRRSGRTPPRVLLPAWPGRLAGPGGLAGLPAAVAVRRPHVPAALSAVPGRARPRRAEDHRGARTPDHHLPVLPDREHRRAGPGRFPGPEPGAVRVGVSHAPGRIRVAPWARSCSPRAWRADVDHGLATAHRELPDRRGFHPARDRSGSLPRIMVLAIGVPGYLIALRPPRPSATS